MIDRVHRDLLSALSSRIFSNTVSVAPDEEVCAEAQQQAVYALIAPNAGARRIAQNLRVLNAHYEMYTLMTEHDIPCVTIKGWASAFYYPDPIQRTLGDVDFLIPLSDREQAVNLMLEDGYSLMEDDDPHHWAYCKDKLEYELHWKINGAPEGPMGDLVESYMQDVYEKAQLVDTPAGAFKIPSDFHNGLISILHMAKHMTEMGMGLRHLCDWAVFVNAVEDFEGTFRDCFTALGIWRFAAIMTAVCVRYLALPEQPWLAQFRFSDELLEATLLDIMGAGNFGKKKTRDYSYKLMGNITSDASTDKYGRFRNMVRSMNELAEKHVPITKKCALLLPIGWVYVVLRYIVRVCKGKKQLLNPVKTISQAKERGELYASFALFQQD